jgi:hypothetical protein
MRKGELFWYDEPGLPDADEVYRHLATSSWCEGDRDYLEALWQRYFGLGLADPDFLKRFPGECAARIWETRLACMFADWNVKLVPSPKRGAGLDFGLGLDSGATAWV